MRLVPLLAAALLCCAPAGSALAAPIPDGAFVRTSGTRFVVNDRPAVFLGANFDPLHGDEQRAHYRDVLRAMARDGMNLGRVWALGEGPRSSSEWSRRYELFRAGPDGFIDASYQQLDLVLAEARALGIRLIVTLSNHWKDFGGVPAYLRWAGLPTEGLAQEAFYADERTRGFYREGLRRLLQRTNTVTGVRYVDDPTIFAWELMNESHVLSATGTATRTAWLIEMLRFVKRHDPHHLVSPGLIGYATRAERGEWARVHALPEVDFCDSHLYLQLQGPLSERALYDQLDDRAQLARFVLRKPLLIGEFGFRTDGPPSEAGAPRASWFGRLLDRVLLNGGGGALVWIYEPFSGGLRDFGIYIDRPATDDIRAAIRQRTQLLGAPPGEARNPRLSAAQGDRLLYDPVRRLLGPQAPQRAWRAVDGRWELVLLPDSFSIAVFERAGVWREGALLHAYGADSGQFTYRFAAPAMAGAPLAEVRIQARLSSEWPGSAAPPDGGSTVLVQLDGVEVGRVRAIPDDGRGRVEEVRVTDPRLLQRLRAGAHALSFVVAEEAGAHGVTIYGPPTGKEKLPPGDYPPVRLSFR